MKRAVCLLMVVAAAGLSGCAACCAPFDGAYPTYGGKWQRVDRFDGRVGSAFYDPSTMAGPSTMYDGEVIYEDGTYYEDGGYEGETIEPQPEVGDLRLN